MDLDYSADERAFRNEVRDWLRDHLPAAMRDKVVRYAHLDRDDLLGWHRILAAKGWIAPAWPQEWGGTGWNVVQRHIFEEECGYAGAPPLVPFGLAMCAPVLLKFGTDAQKQRFLPRIYRGDDFWCQGYSEPASGSDLASLRTTAVRRGDRYIVNGQKLWTTMAHIADWIFCLVRTDFSAPKHEGISFILFDMASKGVSTKPILLISGKSPFCETFFDNVRVPKGQVVGDLNKGWEVAKYLLTHEREMISGIGIGVGRPLGQVAADALGTEAGMLADSCLRADIARFEVDSAAFRFALERTGDLLKAKQANPAISSMLKYYGAELNKRRHELLMTAGGSDALEWESERSRGGDAARSWLRTKANSIEGGTSEIQLNVIAKRILELPGA